MFVGYDREGKTINVAEKKWSRQRLLKLREETDFICPTCNCELELRIGTIISAHFAHKKFTKCPTIKGSLESDYHMKGKLDLYHWFQRQEGISSVKLESYLQETKQRPDLLIEYNQKRIAVEYQCSTIDARILKKRSSLYDQVGVHYLWILGAKSLNRIGAMSFNLSPFQWKFTIYKESTPPYMYSYCSETKSMIVIHNMIPFSSRYVIAELKQYPLQTASLQQVLTPPYCNKRILFREWFQKVRKFRLSPQLFNTKQISKFHQYLYQTKHLPLSYLPTYAFLPLAENYLFDSPAYVWQGWIFIFIDRMPLNVSFKFQEVWDDFSMKVKDGVVSIRSTINKNDVSYTSAIYSYLMKLSELSVIVEENNQFKKEKPIIWFEHIDELLNNDLKVSHLL